MMDVQQPDFLETQKLKNDSFPSINNQKTPVKKAVFIFVKSVKKKSDSN